VSQTLLETARVALRKTTTTFDGEIRDLILAALQDMRRKGIVVDEKIDESAFTEDAMLDPLILRCVILYVQAMFGMDGDVDKKQRLERIYDEQTRALALSSAYNGGPTDG